MTDRERAHKLPTEEELSNWVYDPKEKTFDANGKRICNFPKCFRAHEAKGLCERHYTQHWRRGKELSPILPRKRKAQKGIPVALFEKQLQALEQEKTARLLSEENTLWDFCHVPLCMSSPRSTGFCKEHESHFAEFHSLVAANGRCGSPTCERETNERYCKEHQHLFMIAYRIFRIEYIKSRACTSCDLVSDELIRGKCPRCYKRSWNKKNGMPRKKRRKRRKACGFLRCANKTTRTYCKEHEQQQRRTGKMWPLKQWYPEGLPCMCGCHRAAKAKAHSKTCYARVKRLGKMPTDEQIRAYVETWMRENNFEQREWRPSLPSPPSSEAPPAL